MRACEGCCLLMTACVRLFGFATLHLLTPGMQHCVRALQDVRDELDRASQDYFGSWSTRPVACLRRELSQLKVT